MADPPRHRTRLVMVVVGTVVLFLCSGAALAGLGVLRAADRSTQPTRTAAEAFLTDLERGNYTGAYDRLCQRTRDQFSREAFESGVRAQPALRSHRITQVTVSRVDGRDSGFVAAELSHANGFVDRHSLPMTRDGDTWKVCGQPY